MVQTDIVHGVNPLDLWDLLRNQIAGNDFIFIAFSLLLITILAAKLRVPNNTLILLLVIYGLIISYFFTSVLIFVIIVAVFAISWGLGKFTGRV